MIKIQDSASLSWAELTKSQELLLPSSQLPEPTGAKLGQRLWSDVWKDGTEEDTASDCSSMEFPTGLNTHIWQNMSPELTKLKKNQIWELKLLIQRLQLKLQLNKNKNICQDNNQFSPLKESTHTMFTL